MIRAPLSTSDFIGSDVFGRAPAGCGKGIAQNLDEAELMERLLVDWPVAAGVLERVAACVPPADAQRVSDACRKHGLSAYALASEEEDRHRLLAFVNAVLDTAAAHLSAGVAGRDRPASVRDVLLHRLLPRRVRHLLGGLLDRAPAGTGGIIRPN